MLEEAACQHRTRVFAVKLPRLMSQYVFNNTKSNYITLQINWVVTKRLLHPGFYPSLKVSYQTLCLGSPSARHSSGIFVFSTRRSRGPSLSIEYRPVFFRDIRASAPVSPTPFVHKFSRYRFRMLIFGAFFCDRWCTRFCFSFGKQRRLLFLRLSSSDQSLNCMSLVRLKLIVLFSFIILCVNLTCKRLNLVSILSLIDFQ